MSNQPLQDVILDLPNFCSPQLGICTGGKPSASHLANAKAQGIGTVINFCPAAELGFDEQSVVTELGMHYVNIPVAGAADLTLKNVQTLAAAMDEATSQHPVLLHCASGNRAGAMLALKAYLIDHLPKQQAIDLGVSAGLTALLPVVEQMMAD